MIPPKDENKIHILITATDYARRYNMSRVAVNNWIKEGRIRAVFVGAAWLIEDVIELAEMQKAYERGYKQGKFDKEMDQINFQTETYNQ